MRFGTRNVTSLYTAGSITAATRELERYKLNLAGVQEVGQRGQGNSRDNNFFYRKGNESHQLKQDFFYSTEWYQQLEGRVC
jgi:hypothetical protein